MFKELMQLQDMKVEHEHEREGETLGSKSQYKVCLVQDYMVFVRNRQDKGMVSAGRREMR